MRMFAATLAILGLVGLVVAARQRPTAARWEYQVQLAAGSGIKPDRQQAQLDSLGRAGWELVSVVGLDMGGNTGAAAFYLKRSASTP